MRLSVSSNIGSLIGRWRNREQKLTAAVRRAENRVMDYAKERAEFYSSASAYKIGRDKGYPYAAIKRADYPAVPLPPYFINMQSGELQKSWAVNTQATPQGFTSSLWNKKEYSRFLLGTSKMIQRPILSRVGQDVRRFRLKVENEAIVKVLVE